MKKDYRKTPEENLNEAFKILDEGVKSVFTSEKWKEYLKFCNMFHDYSWQNTMLIFSQYPNASRVAGYKTWQRLGRNVKRGTHGIRIIAPAPRKVTISNPLEGEDGCYVCDVETGEIKTKQEEIVITGFHTVTVFDVEQTYGEPLPTLIDNLEQGVNDYDVLWQCMMDVCPVRWKFAELKPGVNGYYSRVENMIAIQQGMSEAQTVKTYVHEMAHAMMHVDSSDSREVKEMEAESVAYIVCDYYGIDTSDYSFGYIASWSNGKDITEMKSSLNKIQSTVKYLISSIDASLNEKELVRYNERKMLEKAAEQLKNEPEQEL